MAISFLPNKVSYNSFFCILTALSIANRATPTSANTASHKVAMPIAPIIKTITLTPIAKTMFCQTIRFVKARNLQIIPHEFHARFDRSAFIGVSIGRNA